MPILKQSPNRSVRIEGKVVVKRFRHARALGRLRDRRRALHEHDALARLSAAGLRVPRPLGVHPEQGGWAVEMELVPGAVSLADVLEGRAPWPAPAGRVMAALGRTLADLLRAGVDHPDLHPGNVLLEADGRPVLVDFQHARLGVTVRESHVESALANACAYGRERTSPRARARFLLAFLRALPELDRKWRTRAGELERLGRSLRRSRNLRESDRWTRESSLVRRVEVAGRGAVLARRRLAHADVQSLLEGRGNALLLPGPRRDSLTRWTAAGRLLEHAVPVAEPLVLAADLAVFGLPAGARELEGEAREEALAWLTGVLVDRGLALPRGHVPRVFAAPGERPLLAPPPGLVPLGV